MNRELSLISKLKRSRCVTAKSFFWGKETPLSLLSMPVAPCGRHSVAAGGKGPAFPQQSVERRSCTSPPRPPSFSQRAFSEKKSEGASFLQKRLRAGAVYPRSGNIDFILFDVKLFAPKIIASQAAFPAPASPAEPGVDRRGILCALPEGHSLNKSALGKGWGFPSPRNFRGPCPGARAARQADSRGPCGGRPRRKGGVA